MADTSRLMGITRVLKPFWYFEYYYDGQPGSTPIALGPVNPNIPPVTNPPTIDPFAYDEAVRNGEVGYSPNLAAMLPVPGIGSDLLAWIPNITIFGDPGEGNEGIAYAYVPVWRMRTIHDLNVYHKNANIPKETFGAPAPPAGDPRYILPASAGHAVLSTTMLDNASGHLPSDLQIGVSIREAITMSAEGTISLSPPIGPNGNTLEYQQGIVSSQNTVFSSPMFRHMWMKIVGNEFGMLVYKVKIPQTDTTELEFVDWDFGYNPATGEVDPTCQDLHFSSVFGVGVAFHNHAGRMPDSGVFVCAGKTG